MSNTPLGQPGIGPRWTSGAKAGVGTAINRESRVWVTVSHGIVDEIYHPFIDHATIALDTNLALHGVDRPSSNLKQGATPRFTFYGPDAQRWEGKDFAVQLIDPVDRF